MKETYITGIDIGSSAIRIVIGQPSSEDGKQLQVIAAASEVSEGINRGSVSQSDEASRCLTAALEKAERIIGAQIEGAAVGISGPHIVTQPSRGIVAIGKVNGEITRHDVERAIEAARTIATPANYEILHVIPRRSIIDGQIAVKDPIGMMGTRLEVDALVVQGFASEIRNFTKTVYRTGLEIDDLVFSPIAAGDALLTHKQKELGVALITIGAATTSVLVYEEGEIIHSVVLPIGSDHVTNDIAIGLRISIDAAERIKHEFIDFSGKESNKKNDRVFDADADGEQLKVSAKAVAHIIEARMEEIFDTVELELKKIGRSGVLPAGVVLTGGGSKLAGIIDLAKKNLRLPASYASIKGISNPSDDALFDQSFTTAASLALWSLRLRGSSLQSSPFLGDAAHTAGDRVKKWIKSLLP